MLCSLFELRESKTQTRTLSCNNANSGKRIDSKIRFSIEPLPGDDAFNQWRDAMKAVARLPMGIPPEFRKKVWLALADNHLQSLRIDWEKTKRFAFNERSNPDDNKLGLQIVKDLHRTGCSGFSGQDNDEDRAVLKRVLLAYARWNKAVGYCQGFNVLAALILEVVNRREDDALKVMIFLVDHVLPDSYFANNLRALSVDMAVFRDLLALQYQELSKHLDHLQNAARDMNSGANYEPPLTNVFTMQWFLTLFATCLPEATALRVWDSVLLEGSEILLRTALAIWGKLSDRIMAVQSADEFYTTMGVLTQEMLDCRIVDGDELIKAVYTMAPVPFPQLTDLREKYTYNITPFQAAMSTGRKPVKSLNIFSDDDEIDEEDIMDNINCFTGESDRSQSGSSFDVSKISPGAYAAQPENIAPGLVAYAERMSLDLSQLKRQYGRLRERQKQAHIILAAASARHYANSAHRHGKRNKPIIPAAAVVAPIESPVAVNHLFIGRKAGSSSKRNRTIAQAPNIVPLFPNNSIPSTSSAHPDAKVKSDTSDSKHSGKPAKTNRMLSNESTDDSVSNTSVCTMEEMDRTDSYSDVSTVEGDNQVGELDLIELDLANQERKPSVDTENSENASNDGNDSGCSTEGSPEHSPHMQKGVNTLKGVASEKTEKSDEESGSENDSCCSSEPQSSLGPEMNSGSADVVEGSGEGSITQQNTRSDSDNIETPSNNTLTEKKTLNFDGNSITQGPNFRADNNKAQAVEIAQNLSNGKKPTLLQLAQGTHATEGGTSSKSKQTSDLEFEYTRQRALRAGQRISSSSTDSNPSPSSTPTSPQSQKRLFNPFPSQHINQRRTQNGIRLGLYSANNLPKLETGMLKSGGMKHIGRAQLNACLHRQYMAEIKQQARVGKR